MSQEFASQLLAWYDQFGRFDLPWQQNKTPYRVWVSEIMLQQTQVQTVIPYYERFMQSFPDIATLANASESEVLAHWAGLGYYARGRNLHKAAKMIQSEYAGVFPNKFEEIMALPGIGRSTAGAILALAFQQRFPILDGNVKRVLCRYDGIEAWSGQPATEAVLWERATALTPQTRFDAYTQAMMDLGATLCKRSAPACHSCPVSAGCEAKRQGRVAEFPKSKPKIEKPTRHCVLLGAVYQNQIALVKRPSSGIWGGLWSLPEFSDENALRQSLDLGFFTADLLKWKEFKHSFTHYHLWIGPVVLILDSIESLTQQAITENWQWFDFETITQLGLPAPVKAIIKQLEKTNV